jgi:hypothetical protein
MLALNLSEVPFVPLGLIYMYGSAFPLICVPHLLGEPTPSLEVVVDITLHKYKAVFSLVDR